MNGRRAIPGISLKREDEIRSNAQTLLNKIWVMRDDFGLQTNDPERLVLIASVSAIQDIYGFEVVHLEEIPPEDGQFETAGIIDRHVKEITISRKFSLPSRRFTLAHELGHLVLHPGRVYHRDRPLYGGEYLNHSRPVIEKEADLFGAEFLMPTKLLTDIFSRCFGGRIFGSEADNNMSYHFSQATGKRITPRDLSSMSTLDLAKIVAGVTDFGPTKFPSLMQRFSVSKTAMAIQLQDVGLVT